LSYFFYQRIGGGLSLSMTIWNMDAETSLA